MIELPEGPEISKIALAV